MFIQNVSKTCTDVFDLFFYGIQALKALQVRESLIWLNIEKTKVTRSPRQDVFTTVH